MFRCCVATLAAVLSLSSMANASTLYGVDHNSDALYRIDKANGASERIGSLGVSVLFADLASVGNALYLVGGRENPNLFRVDTRSGVATIVGSHGLDELLGLAYDPSSATLYGVVLNYRVGGSLYSLDITSGLPTFIAPLAVGIKGLTYDSINDRLVGMAGEAGLDGTFYDIDRTTGIQTNLGFGGFTSGSDIAFDASDGSYYEVTVGELYRRDGSTFARQVRGQVEGSMTALTFVTGTQVPEPASWALLLTGFACVGGAVRAQRRVRSAA